MNNLHARPASFHRCHVLYFVIPATYQIMSFVFFRAETFQTPSCPWIFKKKSIHVWNMFYSTMKKREFRVIKMFVSTLENKILNLRENILFPHWNCILFLKWRIGKERVSGRETILSDWTSFGDPFARRHKIFMTQLLSGEKVLHVYTF